MVQAEGMARAVPHRGPAGRTHPPAWAAPAAVAAVAAVTAVIAATAVIVVAVAVAVALAPAPAALASGSTSTSTGSDRSGLSKGAKTTTTTHPATLELARSGKIGFWSARPRRPSCSSP